MMPTGPPKPKKRGMTKKKIKPTKKMKAFHWKRVLIDQDPEKESKDTIWRKIGSGDFNFDENEFANLFGKDKKKGDAKKGAAGGEKKQGKKKKKKKDDVMRVLEQKKSDAVAIMLKNLPTIEIVYFGIIKMDSQEFNEDKLTKIVRNLPTPDEMGRIKAEEADNPRVKWDKPERYFKTISKIKCLKLRLKVWLFTYTIGSELEQALKHLERMVVACDQIRESTTLKQILAFAVAVGNYLNGGNKRRGQADGFDVRALDKFRETRGQDRKTTLMHFVAQQVKQQIPDANERVERELKSVLPGFGSMPKWMELDSEVKRIENAFKSQEKNAETVNKAIANSDPEVKKKDKFENVIGPFFTKMKKDVNKMLFERKRCATAIKKLVEYFDTGLRKNVPVPKDTNEYLGRFSYFAQDFLRKWPKDDDKSASGGRRAEAKGSTAVKAPSSRPKMNMKQLGAKALIKSLKKGVPRLRTIKRRAKTRKQRKRMTSMLKTMPGGGMAAGAPAPPPPPPIAE